MVWFARLVMQQKKVAISGPGGWVVVTGTSYRFVGDFFVSVDIVLWYTLLMYNDFQLKKNVSRYQFYSESKVISMIEKDCKNRHRELSGY